MVSIPSICPYDALVQGCGIHGIFWLCWFLSQSIGASVFLNLTLSCFFWSFAHFTGSFYPWFFHQVSQKFRRPKSRNSYIQSNLLSCLANYFTPKSKDYNKPTCLDVGEENIQWKQSKKLLIYYMIAHIIIILTHLETRHWVLIYYFS